MTFNQAPMILLIPTILSLDRAWPMIFHLTIAVILWLPNIVWSWSQHSKIYIQLRIYILARYLGKVI